MNYSTHLIFEGNGNAQFQLLLFMFSLLKTFLKISYLIWKMRMRMSIRNKKFNLNKITSFHCLLESANIFQCYNSLEHSFLCIVLGCKKLCAKANETQWHDFFLYLALGIDNNSLWIPFAVSETYYVFKDYWNTHIFE